MRDFYRFKQWVSCVPVLCLALTVVSCGDGFPGKVGQPPEVDPPALTPEPPVVDPEPPVVEPEPPVVEPDISIQSISLINADTDLVYTGYDVLELDTSINLISMSTRNLNIRVNASQDVESVVIKVNNGEGRTENSLPYSLNDIGGDYGAWPFVAGDYQIVATPYSQDGGKGTKGESKTINVRLNDARWAFSDTDFSFTSKVLEHAADAKEITLSNTGNVELVYTVSGDPGWLTVSPMTAVVVNNAKTKLRFQPAPCTSVGRDETVVTVAAGKLSQALRVKRVCSAAAANVDFALERFYISQTVPAMDSKKSAAKRVSLITARPGLGRAFVSASENTSAVPEVVLNYRLKDGRKGRINLSGPDRVPLTIKEGQLNSSFNVELEKEFFVDGIEMFIEVDPNNLVSEIDETNNRLPAQGYYKPSILNMPPFKITVVPITYKGNSAGKFTEASVRKLLQLTWKMMPLNALDIKIHKPINSSADWGDMLSEVFTLRNAEGSSRAYHGLVKRGPSGNVLGIGYVGRLVAVSRLDGDTIAHETGHNLGLSHAPCGGPSRPDPKFPGKNARISVWGYDLMRKILKAPTLADLMSYCSPSWISDYNFSKVAKVANRVLAKQANNAFSSNRQSVLLVQGSLSAEKFAIESVFSLDTVVLETPAGPYILRGYDDSDRQLFEKTFATMELSHEEKSHFNVNIPSDKQTLAALYRLEISHKDKVLLNYQPASSRLSNARKLSFLAAKNTQAKRLPSSSADDDHQIEITWDKAMYQSVIVRDYQSNQVLGSDKSGRFRIYCECDEVEVIYSDGLKSTSETVVIVD